MLKDEMEYCKVCTHTCVFNIHVMPVHAHVDQCCGCMVVVRPGKLDLFVEQSQDLELGDRSLFTKIYHGYWSDAYMYVQNCPYMTINVAYIPPFEGNNED